MRPIIASLLALTMTLTPAWTQQEAAKQETATFKVESNLVVLNISVKDKNGKPITDIKKNGLSIFEDDKPQKISVFEIQHLEGEVLPAIEATQKTFATRNTPAPAPKPAAPVKAADATPKRFQDKRLISLFFDLSSMQPGEQIRAQDAAIKFLNTQMTAADVVSIMTFAASFKEVQEFTNDRELLISTIRKFRAGESIADGTSPDEDTDDTSFTADESEFNIFNTDRKLSALEMAAKKLSLYPEKKALVYISSGVGKTGMENQAQLRSTVATAVRSNVAFYPIDARGLQATAPLGDASKAGPGGSGAFSGRAQTSQRSSFHDQQETLYTLAADTGGKALLDSNDLSLGITQVQRDVESYYIVGYYSTNANLDGRFRKIRVRLNNNIQAKLDYRQGYFAGKEFKRFNATDKERQLEEALQLGDPVSELGLAIEIDYFRIARDKYFVPVSVKIPGSSVGLTKKGGKQSAEIDFIGQIRDEKNRLAGSVRDAITVKLSESDAAELTHRNLQYDTGLTLAPGNYTLKFLARENLSGKMGTFESKFKIPDLTNDPKALRMSSVVWANQREKVTSAVGSVSNDKKALAAHPLIQDGQKLVPSITHYFRKNQNLYVYAEVYDATSNIQADLVLFSGGRKIFESSPVRVSDPVRPGVIPLQIQVPLARLAPGRYTSQLNIIDEAGKRFAFARTPMVIVP